MEKQTAKVVALLLSRLAIHYYRPDFTEQQARLVIGDMLEDLAGFSVADVEDAIRTHRQDPKAKFFPTSGELRAHALKAVRERAALERHSGAPRPANRGRPILWWTKRRNLWDPGWHESEAPDGALVRDRETGTLRRAYRFAS